MSKCLGLLIIVMHGCEQLSIWRCQLINYVFRMATGFRNDKHENDDVVFIELKCKSCGRLDTIYTCIDTLKQQFTCYLKTISDVNGTAVRGETRAHFVCCV